MSIDFRCPNCTKLLRTPDDSAGKKAKCPQCGTVVDVPASTESHPFSGSQEPLAPVPPGGAASKPTTSPFGDGGSSNPYASPSISGMEAMRHETPSGGAHTGLPWDLGPRSFATYRETVSLVFKTPTEAFRRMAREGGLGPPMTFALIGGVIGSLFTGTYQTILQLVAVSAFNAGQRNLPPGMAAATWIQVALQFPIALLAGTIGVIIGLFVGSGINHLFLMLVGGAKQPFETTFRVSAYVQGTVLLLQVIPFCGQYVLSVVALVYTILGLAAAHEISGGRAAAAVLLPFGICIGLVIVGAVVAIAAVAAQGGFR